MHAYERFPRKLLAPLAVLLLVPAAAAFASTTYPDTAGDAPQGVPDITRAQISHTLAGDITFRVTFANRTILSGKDVVITTIDADQNDATGLPMEGDEYWIWVFGRSPSTASLDPAGGLVTAATGPVTWANRTMTFRFNKTQLGVSGSAFDFTLWSSMDSAFERVPHGGRSEPNRPAEHPELTYSLTTKIAAIKLPKTVTTVKAGKVFTVKGATVKLNTDEVFTPHTLTAKASIIGKVLKPRAGGLSWMIPRAAKDKVLTVTMDASYQEMHATQKLTLRIR